MPSETSISSSGSTLFVLDTQCTCRDLKDDVFVQSRIYCSVLVKYKHFSFPGLCTCIDIVLNSESNQGNPHIKCAKRNKEIALAKDVSPTSQLWCPYPLGCLCE